MKFILVSFVFAAILYSCKKSNNTPSVYWKLDDKTYYGEAAFDGSSVYAVDALGNIASVDFLNDTIIGGNYAVESGDTSHTIYSNAPPQCNVIFLTQAGTHLVFSTGKSSDSVNVSFSGKDIVVTFSNVTVTDSLNNIQTASGKLVALYGY